MKNGGQRIIMTAEQIRKWESVMRKLENQLERERLANNKKKGKNTANNTGDDK